VFSSPLSLFILFLLLSSSILFTFYLLFSIETHSTFRSSGQVGLCRLNDTDNETEQTERGTENFDNQNSHEQAFVLSVRQRTTAANDTDTDTTQENEECD
jgi:hypothetical protein